jgi:hypothetical protein
MKKNIDMADFENIMLGNKPKSKAQKGLNIIKKEKKVVVNTTFEDIPDEINSQDIDMDDFENIILGKQPKKKIKHKPQLTNSSKKKIIQNTTFEEVEDISENIKIKDYNNIDMDEFEKLMLGLYKTKDNKSKVLQSNQNKKTEEIKSVIKSIIIDGSNVLRVMYKMKEQKEKNYETEDRIIVFLYSHLKQYVVDSYDKISLYLDGKKRKINVDSHPDIQLEFSKEKKADDLIVNDLYLTVTQQPTIKKEVLLITNDGELIQRCQEILSSVNVVSSNRFLELLGYSKDFKLFNHK